MVGPMHERVPAAWLLLSFRKSTHFHTLSKRERALRVPRIPEMRGTTRCLAQRYRGTERRGGLRYYQYGSEAPPFGYMSLPFATASSMYLCILRACRLNCFRLRAPTPSDSEQGRDGTRRARDAPRRPLLVPSLALLAPQPQRVRCDLRTRARPRPTLGYIRPRARAAGRGARGRAPPGRS